MPEAGTCRIGKINPLFHGVLVAFRPSPQVSESQSTHTSNPGMLSSSSLTLEQGWEEPLQSSDVAHSPTLFFFFFFFPRSIGNLGCWRILVEPNCL